MKDEVLKDAIPMSKTCILSRHLHYTILSLSSLCSPAVSHRCGTEQALQKND